MENQSFLAIGMISGTSIDGIDTALLETDGRAHVRPLAFMPHAYEPEFREKMRGFFGSREGRAVPEIAEFEAELTGLHAALVQQFLEEINMGAEEIDLVGFHGQTIWHSPENRETIQLGDGRLLAELTGISVVNDFRTADVKAGGHGAPLVPLYHRALAAELPKPVAIVNIGGVSNVTWIRGDGDDEIMAFDMGPGNALLDDWVLKNTGLPFDEYGELAAAGEADLSFVERFMRHPFFGVKPPKSLDRDAFCDFTPYGMGAADGAATLTAMTARAIAEGLRIVPAPPLNVYVAGGGRHNLTMMRMIGEFSGLPVASVDELGWSGDGLEAEAFAYLAVRSKLGLPLSLPGTTGAPFPVIGGVFWDINNLPKQ